MNPDEESPQALQLQPQGAHRIPRGWTEVGWPAREYEPNNCKAALVHDLIEYFGNGGGTELLKHTFWSKGLVNRLVCHVDCQALLSSFNCQLTAALDQAPKEGIDCLSVAVTEEVDSYQGTILVRLVNVIGQLMPIRQLRSNIIGKYVSLKGTVVRMSPVRPMVSEMPFVCGKCRTEQTQTFLDGKFTPPTRCTGQGCKAKTFEALRTQAVCVDWQKIRIQEILGGDKQQEGQVPRTVEVELTSDLVGSGIVGDTVLVYGEIKVLATGDSLGSYSMLGAAPAPGGPPFGGGGAKKGPTQQSLFLIYMNAHSVHNQSRATRSASDKAPGAMYGVTQGGVTQIAMPSAGPLPNMLTLNEKELRFIIDFTQTVEGDQFRQLVHALCPGILGHDLVKAGLLLALMGGVRKNVGIPGRVPIRGDIHVLVVGDPGLGKSQMLQACAAAAPRGLYVCGNTSSGAGLTVSVAKDPVTGDHVFEAGAVVLGDRGVCCVDEFDKMSSEHQSLLEAMEQQEVNVAKAGMMATLPARTSILAAANPAEGHYNKAKSVAENLKMTPAMLSRFDLIFILLDRPDELMDQCVSEHVLALHSGQTKRAEDARQRLLQFNTIPGLHGPQQPLLLGSGQGGQPLTRRPLKEVLHMGPADNTSGLVPVSLLRKYIAYARTHITPVLSDEAKVTLREFYFSLRQQVAPGSSGPITARQLESLARLTEARARIDLREIATKDDALDVIEIMKEALYDKFGGLDDTMLGTTDFRGTGARAKGKAAEAERFMSRLRVIAGRQGKDTFSKGELYALANEMALAVKDIGVFLDQMNDVGELLKAGNGQFRVSGVKPAAPGTSATQGGAMAMDYSQGTQATPSQRVGGSQGSQLGAGGYSQRQPPRAGKGWVRRPVAATAAADIARQHDQGWPPGQVGEQDEPHFTFGTPFL